MLLEIDKNGFVVNEGSKKKIQPKFSRLIQKIKLSCIDFFDKNVQSFYVRGSVCVGRATVGLSDIDCVLVLDRDPKQIEIEWSMNLAKKLEKVHPEVSSIDLTILSLDSLLYSLKYKNLRIFLKTQSALFYGNDSLQYISGVKPGKELALYMYGTVVEELKDLTKIFRTGETRSYLGRKRSLKFWCVWACRIILRSALAVVMADKPIYTPDLNDCKQIFEENYPDFKREMKRVLHWAIKPTNNRKVFSSFLVDFVPKYSKLWENLRKDYEA